MSRARLVLPPLRALGLAAAGLGAVGCAIGAFVDPAQLLRSWLLAAVVWSGIPLGALAILLVHRLTGGAWGRAIAPVLGPLARTLPIVALALVPIGFALGEVYPWAGGDSHADPTRLAHLGSYASEWAWILRSAIAVALWVSLGGLFSRRRPPASAALAGVGLIVHVVLLTVTRVDWVASLDAQRANMVIGVKALAGQMVAALATAVLVLGVAAGSRGAAFVDREDADPDSDPERLLRDLGNLLLATVMLWSYLAFSEWMIVWSANLPHEIEYFVRRATPVWAVVGLALIALHFAIPFALLLSRRFKRDLRAMTWLAALLLVMRYVDGLWLVAPSAGGHGAHWLDGVAPLALGGMWFAVAASAVDGAEVLRSAVGLTRGTP